MRFRELLLNYRLDSLNGLLILTYQRDRLLVASNNGSQHLSL
jgi:hypothetical protein